MPETPIIFTSTHRIAFSELDPYNHLRTDMYPSYFVDHRMSGLRDFIGWDLKKLTTLPFMMWVKRLEVDFIRPVLGDQEITITSFAREFRGSEAFVECTMVDQAGKVLSKCVMVVACVDRATNRSMDWPTDATAFFFKD